MKKNCLLFLLISLLLSCFCIHLYAQRDTITLRQVEITSPRLVVFSTGKKIDMVDSITKMQLRTATVGELISESSNIFIKSYGANGIATASIRGTEARHTAVLWNGFNINSPSLGLADCSLMPVSFADETMVHHGGAGAIYGTSSLGGLVALNNSANYGKHLIASVQSEAGSFGTFRVLPQFGFGTENFFSSTRIMYEKSENDFTFSNESLAGNTKQKQSHAALKNTGVMQNLFARINESTQIETGIWYQDTKREIPPLITSVLSTAEQRDSFLRVFAGIRKSYSKTAFELKGAFFDEHQYYTDSLFRIDVGYKTRSFLADLDIRHYLADKILLISGFSSKRYDAGFKEYNGSVSKSYYSAFAGLQFEILSRLKSQVIIRQEFNDAETSPFAPSVGLEYVFMNGRLTLKASSGRNFNFPGMNDLYWQPGGNTSLKPESGWQHEAGVLLRTLKNKNLVFENTFYYMKIENWIQWQPVTAGYYSAQNLKKVFARGSESSIEYSWSHKKITSILNLKYSYTKSTNLESTQPLASEIIDKQLIYIPEHKAIASLHFRYRNISLSYIHQFNGKVFTTFDNSSSLPSYHLSNIRLTANFNLKTFSLAPYIRINNVMKQDYYVIALRPMPGISYTAGIIISTMHKKTIKSKSI